MAHPVRIGSLVADPDGEIGEVVGRTHKGLVVVDYDGLEIGWGGSQLRHATPTAITAATKKRKYKPVSGKIDKGIADRMRNGKIGESKKKATKAKSDDAAAKRKSESAARKAEREAERARKKREAEAKRAERDRAREQRRLQAAKGRGVKAQRKSRATDPEFDEDLHKRDASGQFSDKNSATNFSVNGGRVNRGDHVSTADGSRRGRVMGRTADGRVVIVSDDGKQSSHDRFALSDDSRNDKGFDLKSKDGLPDDWASVVEQKKASAEFLYAVQNEFETADRQGRNPVFHLGPNLADTVKRIKAAGHSIMADAEGRYYLSWQGRKIRLKGYTRREDDV